MRPPPRLRWRRCPSEEPVTTDDGAVQVKVDKEAGTIMEAVRRLDGAGIGADDVAVKRPTLDDVFLELTGRELSEDEAQAGTEQEGVAS